MQIFSIIYATFLLLSSANAILPEAPWELILSKAVPENSHQIIHPVGSRLARKAAQAVKQLSNEIEKVRPKEEAAAIVRALERNPEFARKIVQRLPFILDTIDVIGDSIMLHPEISRVIIELLGQRDELLVQEITQIQKDREASFNALPVHVGSWA